MSEVSLDFTGNNGFLAKAENERSIAADSRCRQNVKFVNFTTSFARLRQRNVPKYVLHVQIDWFSSFNQSHHGFCRRCSNLLISALQRDDASRD